MRIGTPYQLKKKITIWAKIFLHFIKFILWVVRCLQKCGFHCLAGTRRRQRQLVRRGCPNWRPDGQSKLAAPTGSRGYCVRECAPQAAPAHRNLWWGIKWGAANESLWIIRAAWPCAGCCCCGNRCDQRGKEKAKGLTGNVGQALKWLGSGYAAQGCMMPRLIMTWASGVTGRPTTVLHEPSMRSTSTLPCP